MIAKAVLLTYKVIEVEYEEGEDWFQKLSDEQSETEYLVDFWNGNNPDYIDQQIKNILNTPINTY